MTPANLYTMEAVNLVCGDAGTEAQPGHSTHLTIQELKLPGMEEAYVDHTPGGAPMGIEIPMHINRLEATFNLAGWQPSIMGLLATAQVAQQRYTAYGLIRDRRTGQANQAIGIMQGRLGRVNPAAFRKGDLQNHEYSIRSIVHYELVFKDKVTGPQEIIYWDFFTSEFRMNGVDINRDMILALAIPGAAA